MLNRKEIINDIEKNKIIVILRGFNKEQLLKTVDAMEKGGIRLVEVPFDQTGNVSAKETASYIKAIKESFNGRIRVGAGTVMSVEQVELAYNAGAEFIISPDCYQPVIQKTRELNMVSIPGSFTPTEVANAHRYGADFVKFFPNSEVNISYLKALMTPLSHVKFLAASGISADNILEYISIGVKGVGIATNIADKTAIFSNDYQKITTLAKTFTDLLKTI